jgi:NADH:ubiquinone oxidoreductase subunit 6 (subunit J)
MTYNVAIMYVVAVVLGLIGAVMLLRLASPRITERQTYAYRMTGVMLVSAAVVLAMSATAMWQWSMPT